MKRGATNKRSLPRKCFEVAAVIRPFAQTNVGRHLGLGSDVSNLTRWCPDRLGQDPFPCSLGMSEPTADVTAVKRGLGILVSRRAQCESTVGSKWED